MEKYLVDVIILLAAAVVIVPLLQVARLGTVPGLVIAGILVGPTGFRLVENIEEISRIAELGVVFLLFVIGMELKPSRFWLMRRQVLGLGLLQIGVTSVIVAAICYGLFGMTLRLALLVGPALALSSTAFVLQLLTEQGALGTRHGRACFAVLIAQDLAVVPLLALVPLLASPQLTIGQDLGIALLEAVVIMAIIIVGGRYLLHPVMQWIADHAAPELVTASAILLVLGTAMLTAKAGLSMALGAFLAGLLIADSSYRHGVMREIEPFRGLLIGLFFMSMGLSLDGAQLAARPLAVMGLVSGLVLIKAAVLWPLARFFQMKTTEAFAVALLLAQSGEFALAVFAVAKGRGLLPEPLFQQLLLVTLLSMLVTPLLAKVANRLVETRSGSDAATP
ncbi:MAG: monovalent cation:proton antiporter-2 (CPA2) family protein [Gammaproteobacteria bacterium]|nr:monovalent cation:proton antiporter-2 (CPA2) family protein [Gammaproteobacteria bacterium]